MSSLGDTESLPLDHEELLDQVLADYLRDVAAGRKPDRQALLDQHPDLAGELTEFFNDQDHFKDIASPLRAAVARTSSSPLPESVGPHEVLGEIARGGMGVVLRARHRTLGRLVALKLLLAGPFAGRGDVARFRREAEAVASLDHPHIVPIYEVGEHQGLPFFTMKLMRGSLAQCLDGKLAGRDAALLVATVARAVHHAHQRGILHRDIKPANILLDEHGQPHVSDFGLARRGDSSILTTTGTVVGTPAYMAPEQAAGKHSEITVASDVYSLGALLHECLTGRPPFRGDTPLDTLRQVLDQEPARLRSLDPTIHLDLETVCLKCLEKDPGRRYASAADLAAELERYLAGEPIRARRLGLLARLWQHRPVASRSSPGWSWHWSWRWRLGWGWSCISGSRPAGSATRPSAAPCFASRPPRSGQTRPPVLRRPASGSPMPPSTNSASPSATSWPTVPACRRCTASSSRPPRRYYQEFVRQRGHEPALQRELADTHVRVAQITARIGEGRAALTAYREALAIYRRLHEEKPDDPILQRKLAGTLSNLSNLQDAQEGQKTSDEALALYRRFRAARPDNLDLAAGLNLLLANRGSRLIGAGRFERAEEYLKEALVEQDRLANRYPWNDSLWSELAGTLDNYGVLLARLGRRAESLCCYLRAQELREKLARARPADVTRQANLAAIRHHIGLALRDLGQIEASRKAFEEALAVRRQLADANPLVTRFQADLAGSLTNLGVMHNRSGQHHRALACFHQVRSIHERLVDQDPASPGLRKLLGEAWFNVGTTHGAMKKRVLEGEALGRARRLQEALLAADPDNAEYRHELGRTLNNLGINLWVRQREVEATLVLRQGITSTGQLVARCPEVRSYRRLLNNHHGLLAEIEWRRGNAAASVEQVLARWKLWKSEPDELFNVGREIARAAALWGPDPGRLPEARRQQQARWLELAVSALTEAVESGFTDARRLREDESLKILNGRADFQQLLRRLD